MQNTNSRRQFIRTSTAGALAGASLGVPAVLSSAQSAQAIKVGLVGCGGRGTGAAAQALAADDMAVLTAVADIDMPRIEQSLAKIEERQPGKIKVASDKRFIGLDAFQKVIDSDIDVLLLATPPGFRPQHLRAAVEAGKHIFCEKPVAVDAPGIRSVLESVRIAKEKGLSLVSGFCWRYHAGIQATFEQVGNGAIGDIVSYYATFYTRPVKPMPPAADRPAGMSDVEWQVRNWYNFVWLSGDSLVEQAVHSVDKIAWAMGDQVPVSCLALGGRQIPANGGNIFDHFEVNYLYPNGVRAFMGSRHFAGCHNENADYMMGTKGRCSIGRGARAKIEGETTWSYEGPRSNMYQEEHDVLFRSIRRGEPVNDGERMANSTMVAIMGRMSAYTGQQLTWERALASEEKRVPDTLDWNGEHEVPEIALPGITTFV